MEEWRRWGTGGQFGRRLGSETLPPQKGSRGQLETMQAARRRRLDRLGRRLWMAGLQLELELADWLAPSCCA